MAEPASADDLPASADDLYGVDPAEFIAARTALARRLRAEGDRDAATRVAKLRRPPQSTWALNLLARTQPDRIDAVFAAATALRDALAGNGADRREAQADYRTAIDAAVAAAATLADVTADDMRNRIRTNLLAAGVDEDLAMAVQRGVLPDDQEAPGFGGTPTIGPIAPRPDRPPASAAAGPKPEPPAKAGRPTKAARGAEAARSGRATPVADAGDRDAEAAARAAADHAEERARAARAAEDELARKRVARKRAELTRELERLEKKARRMEEQAVTAEERAAFARRAADAAAAATAEVAEQLESLEHATPPSRPAH